MAFPTMAHQCRWYYQCLVKTEVPNVYYIAQNASGGKHWQVCQSSIDSPPKFYNPKIVNALICNTTLAQFAKVEGCNEHFMNQ